MYLNKNKKVRSYNNGGISRKKGDQSPTTVNPEPLMPQVGNKGDIPLIKRYQNGGNVPSEKTNWWDNKNYADFYDFASDKNVNRHLLRNQQTSPTSGRHKRFHRYLQSPEATAFSSDHEGYQTFSKDKSNNQEFKHPRDLTEMIFNLDEDQIAKLYKMGMNTPNFDLHSDPAGGVSGDGYTDKQLRRTFDPNKKGKNQRHIRDVNRINELTGFDLQPGNEAFLFMKNFKNSPLLKDALMAKYPGLDPGANRGAYRVRDGVGADQGGMGGQFINAPADYMMNIEASGIDPRHPSNEWLNVQHTFSESGGDEKGMINALMNNPDVMQRMASTTDSRHIPRSIFKGPDGRPSDSDEVFGKGITIYNNGKYYSDFLRRELTDAEKNHWQQSVASKYVGDSGWVNAAAQKTELGSKEGPSGFDVPSNTELGKPGPGPEQYITTPTKSVTELDVPSEKTLLKNPPLSFTGGGDDAPAGLTGTVSIDEDEMRRLNFSDQTGGVEVGPITGGQVEGETVMNAREKGLKDQSINAVMTSMKNKTHVKTGEGYNQADLDRDAKIIKDRFGDDAYQDLLGQVGNMGVGEPSSDQSAITIQKKGPTDLSEANILSSGMSTRNNEGGNRLRSAIGGKTEEEIELENEESGVVESKGREITADNEVEIKPEIEMAGDFSEVITPEIVSPFPDADLDLSASSSSVVPFATGGRLNKMYMKNGGTLNKMYMQDGGKTEVPSEKTKKTFTGHIYNSLEEANEAIKNKSYLKNATKDERASNIFDIKFKNSDGSISNKIFKKYSNGGMVKKKSLNGFYDQGGQLITPFGAENSAEGRLAGGKAMYYTVPTLYEKSSSNKKWSDTETSQQIRALKSGIAQYKSNYDPNDPAQVARLTAMEEQLDGMTIGNFKYTHKKEEVIDAAGGGSDSESKGNDSSNGNNNITE